ncbi:hypothetical protein GCM10029992_20740 [Glycomyces albus]
MSRLRLVGESGAGRGVGPPVGGGLAGDRVGQSGQFGPDRAGVAEADLGAHGLGDQVQDAVVAHQFGVEDGFEGAQASFPVEVGAVLVGDGRDREDHVGHAGDRRVPQFEGDDEARGVEGGLDGGGVGEVVGVDAADQERVDLAVGGGLEDLPGAAPVGAGEGVGAPVVGELFAVGRVVGQAAAGQESGQASGFDGAAVAGAAGHPGDAGAGGGGESDGRREGAFDSGEAFAQEDDGAVFGQGVVDGSARAPGVEQFGLFAGQALDEVGVQLAGASGREGARTWTRWPFLRTAFLMRRNAMGHSSSTSSPAARTTGAFSRSS